MNIYRRNAIATRKYDKFLANIYLKIIHAINFDCSTKTDHSSKIGEYMKAAIVAAYYFTGPDFLCGHFSSYGYGYGDVDAVLEHTIKPSVVTSINPFAKRIEICFPNISKL